MTAICVEDEALILQLTVSLCRELPTLDEVQGFQKGQDALRWLESNTAQIALLDIDMPDMGGLALAEKIQHMHPDISIIFLTGYAQYAVEAFALHVSGYLLKPISREKLAAEIEYAISMRSSRRAPAHVTVRTFGNFEILVDGKAVTFNRAKAKELLAYLVDRRGTGVTRAEIFSVLWENGTYDRARQKQLDVIIRSLRDTLQQYRISEIYEMRSGFMRICPEQIDCDLYRFLNGEPSAMNAYQGEYMSSYAWATMTEAFVTQNRSRQKDE